MNIQDKLRWLKGRAEIEVKEMADDVVTLASANHKTLVSNYFNALIGVCRIYAIIIESKVDDGYKLARRAVESSCTRQGIDFCKIAKYIW